MASRDVFASADFDDEVIHKQLVSLDHQLLLADHGAWIETLGPCTVLLARALAPAKTRADAIKCVQEYFQSPSTPVDKAVASVLAQNAVAVLTALRVVAESYIARSGRGLPSWGEGAGDSLVPEVTLVGEESGARYVPKKFLARGSAGLVYAAEVEGGASKRQVALKRVYPTQFDSALNEYKIARRIRDCRACLSYEDIVRSGPREVWLVLPLIDRSETYGVDLREYLTRGYFQIAKHEGYARRVAVQLLEGLADVSNRGVIMRDVKPDNVLLRVAKDGTPDAFWTDFGLAVDLGPELDGTGLRRVTTDSKTAEEVQERLTAWWYDACKLVPRPKWQARRPPERGFTDPRGGAGKTSAHAFDAYMVGIIFVCMALGVDIPHLDQADAKEAFERQTNIELPKDYLKTLELGMMLRTHPKVFLPHFETTFGSGFGAKLFHSTVSMLSMRPEDRPLPQDVLSMLPS